MRFHRQIKHRLHQSAVKQGVQAAVSSIGRRPSEIWTAVLNLPQSGWRFSERVTHFIKARIVRELIEEFEEPLFASSLT